MEQVHDRLVEIFGELFDDPGINLSPATVAADIEGWDSVMHLNVMFAVEKAFGVQFKGDEFGQVQNVGEIETLLKEKMAARP
jgi:acyl carrier protein